MNESVRMWRLYGVGKLFKATGGDGVVKKQGGEEGQSASRGNVPDSCSH